MPGFALHILFFLSGAAALGYQLIWSKMFSTGLGHEMPAVLAIIGAFMAGMALGAWSSDRFIPRSLRAGLWLGVLELTIGAWAIAGSFFISHLNELVVRLIGLEPSALKHWAFAFAVPLVALLPATFAMGATLPAMEKFVSAVARQNESFGSVYAANTFGAVIGTLLTPHLLMPTMGFSRSSWALGAINGLVGVSALALARVSRSTSCPKVQARTFEPKIPLTRLRITLFATGFLGIGYEVAGVRVLSQVLKNTVFTYAAALAIFLLGTAAGAAAYHRWWQAREPRRLSATLLCSTALACFAGTLLMARTPWLYSFMRELGDSKAAVFAAELAVGIAVFALPTFCMGATFTHLAQMARGVFGHIGQSIAINTIGSALAPAVFGVVLLPLIGTKWTLLLVSLGYALMSPTKPDMRIAVASIAALAGGLLTDLRIISVPPGGQVIHYHEGVMASVAVIAEGNERTLRVDNSFQMGGTGAADAEYRQAHIPLLLQYSPRRALFLGLGTGMSFGAASLYPQLEADGAELVPEAVDAMRFFEPQNFAPRQQPNLKIHVADARRFVRVTDKSYDVIISDVFHPYRDGAGALYTREHFAASRRRLSPNGIFCQWLPLHQLDEQTLRVIVRTFQGEFPVTQAWLLRFNVDVPVIALVGRLHSEPLRTNAVETSAMNIPLINELKRLGLADSLRFYGHLLAGPEELRAFAGNAALNTDDDQRVTFMAPRLAYQRNAKPYSSLLALLEASKAKNVGAGDFSNPDEEFARKLTQYIKARNIFLHGLIQDAEGRGAEAIAAYIESARQSSEFTAGYARCLKVVSIIADSNLPRAREILTKLIEAQPDRPVAREMLRRLSER